TIGRVRDERRTPRFTGAARPHWTKAEPMCAPRPVQPLVRRAVRSKRSTVRLPEVILKWVAPIGVFLVTGEPAIEAIYDVAKVRIAFESSNDRKGVSRILLAHAVPQTPNCERESIVYRLVKRRLQIGWDGPAPLRTIAVHCDVTNEVEIVESLRHRNRIS